VSRDPVDFCFNTGFAKSPRALVNPPGKLVLVGVYVHCISKVKSETSRKLQNTSSPSTSDARWKCGSIVKCRSSESEKDPSYNRHATGIGVIVSTLNLRSTSPCEPYHQRSRYCRTLVRVHAE